ncbi:MAG TPA: sulfite exporter TauE/SafE family protein [Burkholderiales bacterium]|nr:sulfite exporter TauE/SafE family protein [Burkholderiales bacterium]
MIVQDAGLFIAGFVSWAISTLSAGGGSMLMVAAASAMLGGHAIAPVVTCTSLVAAPARMALFWEHIDWRVARWYLPGAVAGALLGSWIFTLLSAQIVQTCVALFLISTVWQYRAGERTRSFLMRLRWFPAVAFVSGLTSAVVGASGLLANPFYLNYGMVKERMIATRAVNSLSIQVVKIGAYAALGALDWDLLRHGLSAGAGAALAIWISRTWLRHLDSRLFRQLTVLVMLIAGILALWQQRAWLLGLAGLH